MSNSNGQRPSRRNPFDRSPSENEDFRFQSDQPLEDEAEALNIQENGESVALEHEVAGPSGSNENSSSSESPSVQPNNETARPDNEEALSLASSSRFVFRNSVLKGNIDKADYGSIVIPICGTLSRPMKKKSVPQKDEPGYKKTIRERIGAMCLKEELADVHFSFETPEGIERVPAHSYVLSVSSSVFYAQFCGSFERENEIKVVDVDCEAFKVMLRYIYSDEVHLNMDIALNVLYAAKRYLVEYLIEATLNFLASNLNAYNVCTFLAQSNLFDENVLMQSCWLVLDAQAEVVLRSDGFRDLSIEQVNTIIARDSLNASELTVFESVVEWAIEECRRKNLDSTPSNVRSTLSETFFDLRLPLMPVEAFANGPAMSKLLTSEETTTIFLRLTAKEKPETPFCTRPRQGLSLYGCSRFQASACKVNQWRYRGRCDAVQFSVDRRIFLAGMGLYGSSSGPWCYGVLMELKQYGNGQRVLGSVETSYKSDGSNMIAHVFFPNPIQIEADIPYTASVTIEGKKLSFFGQEGLPEVPVTVGPDSVVNFSFQCSLDSKNGTGVQGGQIPELLFYV